MLIDQHAIGLGTAPVKSEKVAQYRSPRLLLPRLPASLPELDTFRIARIASPSRGRTRRHANQPHRSGNSGAVSGRDHLVGTRFRRGQRNLRDYFLGGRTAPWWALAVSIVATETSTLTIIGTPGIAFTSNLGFLQLAIGYVVARVVLCVIMVPRYFQGEFYTAYQLLENRFGARTRSVAAAVFLATRVAAEGVRIAAIGKVVSVAFGSSERVSVCVIALLTIFYTFEGGMKAVIWTDVVQFAL